jgi:glycosyltransferase involved in cell wall biosynthesis
MEQSRQGISVTVVTVDDPAGSPDYIAPLLKAGVTVHRAGPRQGLLGRGPDAARTLRMVLNAGVDVVHIHALWDHFPHCAAALAQEPKTPYLIRPAGMLEPHALRIKRMRKALHLALRGRRDLSRAAAIHATAPMEARNIAALSFGNPVLILPNGLDVHEYLTSPRPEKVGEVWPRLAGKRLILFMGRVDPIKGTAFLAEAWGRLSRQFPDWTLVIAGPDWRGHQAQFEADLEKRDVRDTTVFVGPVYGFAKYALLASCDLMVQPSFQENFGITIAESLASARPVITTTGTPWSVLKSGRMGWWVDIGVDPLHEAMHEAMSRPAAELREMGQRGRSLVEERFAWPSIAQQLTRTYEWMLGRAAQPEFVYPPGSKIPD